jgi:hypothetical protein
MVNPSRGCCTMCTGDRTNNVWFQSGAPGFPGKCRIDDLTYGEVVYILSKNPFAKRDLLRITTDPNLVRLANESRMIESEGKDNERAADRVNANTLPFYTVFKGLDWGGGIR